MPLWRIRILVPDDPGSRSAVTDVLAAQSVTRLRVLPNSTAASAKTGEIVVELPQDEGLTSVLSALHEISPQVFVSRADEPEPTSAPDGLASVSAPDRPASASSPNGLAPAATRDGLAAPSDPDDGLVPDPLPRGSG